MITSYRSAMRSRDREVSSKQGIFVGQRTTKCEDFRKEVTEKLTFDRSFLWRMHRTRKLRKCYCVACSGMVTGRDIGRAWSVGLGTRKLMPSRAPDELPNIFEFSEGCRF